MCLVVFKNGNGFVLYSYNFLEHSEHQINFCKLWDLRKKFKFLTGFNVLEQWVC